MSGEPARQVEDMDCRVSGEVKLLQVKHRGGTTNDSQSQTKAMKMQLSQAA